MVNVDIVAEFVNTLEGAAKIAAANFENQIKTAPAAKKQAYIFISKDDFKSGVDAVNAAYNAKTGWGKTLEHCQNDGTGVYAKIHSRVNGFLTLKDLRF